MTVFESACTIHFEALDDGVRSDYFVGIQSKIDDERAVFGEGLGRPVIVGVVEVKAFRRGGDGEPCGQFDALQRSGRLAVITIFENAGPIAQQRMGQLNFRLRRGGLRSKQGRKQEGGEEGELANARSYAHTVQVLHAKLLWCGGGVVDGGELEYLQFALAVGGYNGGDVADFFAEQGAADRRCC
jgi:hypothetical protein